MQRGLKQGTLIEVKEGNGDTFHLLISFLYIHPVVVSVTDLLKLASSSLSHDRGKCLPISLNLQQGAIQVLYNAMGVGILALGKSTVQHY